MMRSDPKPIHLSMKHLRLLVTLVTPLLLVTPGSAGGAPPDPADSVVLVRSAGSMRRSRGSGFIVGDGGWVVTAGHVVAVSTGRDTSVAAGPILVHAPWTGRAYEATIAMLDPAADLALLRLPVKGIPALKIGLDEAVDAETSLNLLRGRDLTLFGFPMTYGEDTIGSLARAEHITGKMAAIVQRDDQNLLVLTPDPAIKPGWSGGPILRKDTSEVIAVFQSLYHPDASAAGQPAGSLSSSLKLLLQRAKSESGALPDAGSSTRPAGAAELLAAQLRYLAWRSGGHWQKAWEQAREALDLAPDDPILLSETSETLVHLKKASEAVALARKASAGGSSLVTPLLALSRALIADGKATEAIPLMRAAAAQRPGEVEVHLALAELLEKTEKFDEAVAALSSAAEVIPGHPGLLARLGQMQARAGQQEEGLKTLEKAAALAQSDAELSWVHVTRGIELTAARKFKEAEGSYRHALRLDNTNAHGHFYLALLFYRLARFDDAQVQLNAGIRQRAVPDDLVEAFRSLQARINERGG